MTSSPPFLRRPVSSLLALSLVAGTALLAGCGGSSGAGTSSVSPPPSAAPTKAASGRVVVTVQWPATASSRLIPQAANVIHLDVLRTVGGVPTLVGSGEAVRPAGSTTSVIQVDNLPIDTLTVVASAYPGTEPANRGVAVAAGSVPVATQDGQVVGFSLTLSSTIDHLSLAPGVTIAPGAQQQMTATAWNGPDETTASVVLLSPAQLQWASSDETVATVSSTGIVAGVTPGTPTLTVTDLESTKTASTLVAVPVVIAVTPVAAALSVTDGATLTATVAGVASPTVTWNVVEGASGGTVGTDGKYTAPQKRGTYHVTATYVSADKTQTGTATATLTVQAGNTNGIVR